MVGLIRYSIFSVYSNLPVPMHLSECVCYRIDISQFGKHLR